MIFELFYFKMVKRSSLKNDFSCLMWNLLNKRRTKLQIRRDANTPWLISRVSFKNQIWKGWVPEKT